MVSIEILQDKDFQDLNYDVNTDLFAESKNFTELIHVSASTLPYSFYYGSAVVYNNEIHILGGDGNATKHYKYNGSSWTSVSTIPYNFYRGGAVVYNNEIHLLGGSGNGMVHYKWNGSSWTSVSTMPYNFYYWSPAIVYNNEIHIMGSGINSSSYATKHYKWDGSSWTSVSTLPYNFCYGGSAVVYNNEIHILGSNKNQTAHYKYDGSSWISVSTLPYSFYDGSAVVYNDGIHILGSGNSSYYKNHYALDVPTELSQMYLPAKTYIICDHSTSVSSTPSNLTKFTYGYIVNNTGIVTISGNFALCYSGIRYVL